MSQAMVNFRMDADLKREMEGLQEDGINLNGCFYYVRSNGDSSKEDTF